MVSSSPCVQPTQAIVRPQLCVAVTSIHRKTKQHTHTPPLSLMELPKPDFCTDHIDVNRLAVLRWDCSVCTFINEPLTLLCEMCGTPKVGYNMRPRSNLPTSCDYDPPVFPYWELGEPITKKENCSLQTDTSRTGTALSAFPAAVWCHIFAFLCPRDRLNASCVCWEWRFHIWSLFTDCDLSVCNTNQTAKFVLILSWLDTEGKTWL
jgi:hypothetical protein